MAFIRWDEKYLTGIQFLDEQHKTIITLANELAAKIFDCQDIEDKRKPMTKILPELMDCINKHLYDEEAFMLDCNYPEYEKHKRDHEALIRYVTQLMTQHYEGKAVLSFPTFMFVKNWVEKHVLEDDKKYGEFIQTEELKRSCNL